MGLTVASAIAVLLLATSVVSWDQQPPQPQHHAAASNGSRPRLLDDPSFSRFEANFNDENNASLYLPQVGLSKRSDSDSSSSATTVVPASLNETSGRALDIDSLLSGAASSNEQRDSGDRESRIINDGPKHEIQGFIPIISLKQSAPRAPQPMPSAPIPHPGFQQFDSYESVLHPQPPGYPGFMGQEPPKGVFGGLGAAIQSLKMKRKQSYDQQDLVPGRDCLCVPFYMCKSGFLETTAKNSAPAYGQQLPQPPTSASQAQAAYNALNQGNKEYFDQQVAAAQAELAAAIPSNFNPYTQASSSGSSPSQRNIQQSSQSYPQPVYDPSNLDQSLPVDERSIDPPSAGESSQQGRSTHFPANESDVSLAPACYAAACLVRL